MKKLILAAMLVLCLTFVYLRVWPGSGGFSKGPQYNLIFVTVDTLRPDHTPFGGYQRQTMPATAKFFRNGVVFEKAETVRTITTPSYASMLSGMYPYKTGVRNMYIPLHSDVDTLQEKLKRDGYLTAGIVSS